MKVITVASGKGGSTKTATVCLLAVSAMQEGLRVCLFDLDAAANLTQWWICRERPRPQLLDKFTKIHLDIKAVRASGEFDLLLIDTPPGGNLDLVEICVMYSDATVIPVRAAAFDLNSATAIVEICQKRRRPYSFLLSAVDPRFRSLNTEMLKVLTEDGPVFITQIAHRLQYVNALTAGLIGSEIDPSLGPEVQGLWNEVKAFVGMKDDDEDDLIRYRLAVPKNVPKKGGFHGRG